MKMAQGGSRDHGKFIWAIAVSVEPLHTRDMRGVPDERPPAAVREGFNIS